LLKNKGIFFKVFIYTLAAVLLLVALATALFSQQFMSVYRAAETRQIFATYQPLVGLIQNNESGDIAEIAENFHDRNRSFEFFIADNTGAAVYATPNADVSDEFLGDFYYVVHKEADFSVIAQTRPGMEFFYYELLIRALIAFTAVFAVCLACAYFFARQMTEPIKRLADIAGRMSKLEDVPPLPGRKDELGDLTRDVYSMYEKLKETIKSQRYFFAAASHELKTPVASTSVLLEGMLENVGDYKDHSKYLRECLKLMDTQSEIVTEILELIALDDGKVVPQTDTIDIGQMIAGIVSDVQTLADANGLTVTADVPPDRFCLADTEMLKKAFYNIVLNAVQNTSSGDEIRIWSEPVGDLYRLSVLNTGASIPTDILPMLFEPFYRMDKARSRKDKRSGLGLTIVQKTLTAMSIPFALENSDDGVLFRLDLPKAEGGQP
jgi:two-component system sensor histidine kinase VanS